LTTVPTHHDYDADGTVRDEMLDAQRDATFKVYRDPHPQATVLLGYKGEAPMSAYDGGEQAIQPCPPPPPVWTVKELVTGTRVQFMFYRQGELWYEVIGRNFAFPVPITDADGATFNREDKAILFMRYIRKQLEALAAERTIRRIHEGSLPERS
jgi:hypothetical protein